MENKSIRLCNLQTSQSSLRKQLVTLTFFLLACSPLLPSLARSLASMTLLFGCVPRCLACLSAGLPVCLSVCLSASAAASKRSRRARPSRVYGHAPAPAKAEQGHNPPGGPSHQNLILSWEALMR